ncbi:MAG: BTAD domain-containing putative transcriptional regulator [Bradyrhizobium sp.]|uniref:BTAD domain-containing putative transcriptional regulator n=1 Tax=Bradyrhizobium sp. TaxID=376 RepID=UPI00353C71B0
MRAIATVQSMREVTGAPEGAHRLSISLVGRLALRLDGRPLELRTRKAAAVLGYLALSETKQESRERLVGLLWSRSDEEKARASLRQVVRELRQTLEEAGFEGFSAGRLSLGFDRNQVEVDIETILQQAERARVHPLLLDIPRLDDRLLEGLDDLDPSFRVWVLAKRQTIQERLMRHLEAALTAADAAGEPGKAIATAIFHLDPTHEQACCCLMRTHAEEGDVAGALRTYKALWDLLDQDYGMEPSKVTQDLVARIKLGEFESAADRRGRGAAPAIVRIDAAARDRAVGASMQKAPAKPRLLLNPFAMHGVDSGRAHLVQGFALHLAASLVRFREWSVIDRPVGAASLTLLDAAPQYCLDTTAYQAGAEINMVMVLRDETTGIFVWSESLRLGLDNWFETQQRIIRRIATSLNVQLSAERLRRLAGEADVSLDVYDRWLRGQSLMAKFDPESWRRAVDIFQDAIRENPTFSPCCSSLVQMNNIEHFVHPGLFLDPVKARETLELAKIAVQLDPVDSRAHLCCGWSHVLVRREADALPHMELACELNDNDPWTLLSSGAYHGFCGSIERARLRSSQALALSPMPSRLEWGYHSIIRFLCGDYSGAIVASDEAQGVVKTLSGWRAAALHHLGHRELAQQEAQRFLNGTRSFWVGSSAPTDEAIVRWLLQAHPISVTERWEALRDGLRGAGLPVEGIVQQSR